MFGEPHRSACEDDRLLRGDGAYLDDLGHDALACAFVRSPHAHAEVLDIDVTAALDVDGLVAIYTYEDLPGRLAEPLPLLIPHPDAHPRPDPVRAGPRRGQPRGRADRHGRRPRPLPGRGRGRADRRRATSRCRPWSGSRRRERPSTSCIPTCPATWPRPLVQSVGDVEAALAAAPHVLELDLVDRALGLDPAGGPRRAGPLGHRGRAGCGIWTLDPDLDRGPGRGGREARLALADVDVITPDVGGGFGVKIMHPWPEEVLVPWAARLLGQPVKFVEDRREHFIASAHERAQLHHVRVGFDDDGRHARAGRAVLARPRRLHRRTASSSRSSPRPSCSGRTSRAPTGSSSTRSTRTR